MSEADEPGDLRKKVSEFIDQKWKHSACELCGTDGWMIYPEDVAYVYLSVADKSGPPQVFAHRSVAFLPVSCVNCGNLRLVDARIFEKWRKAKETGTAMSPS